MHDPDVVAFEIRRPWPRGRGLGGRRYWPALVTVWHREPGGHDSGEVCPHYWRWQLEDGTWTSRTTSGWRWHVWHWRVQLHTVDRLRRRWLSRCAGCGGRDADAHRLDTGRGWDTPRTRWWQGEADIWHGDCLMAHRDQV